MLTLAQRAKYWREWSDVCDAQGWAGDDDERRYALHAAAGCPRSTKDFSNRDFSRFLAACAPLYGKVEIRDRDRENVTWTIQQLGKALHKFRGVDPERYAQAITRDMHDTADLDSLPTEDRGYRDLTNLRNTLRNRMSSALSACKAGRLPWPDGTSHWSEYKNDDIIAAIISGHPIPEAKAKPRRYSLHVPNTRLAETVHPF